MNGFLGRRSTSVISLFVTAGLLFPAAAFNRTPLLFFGDSIGYLRAAMTSHFEPHAYMYSLFLRYASLQHSTWFVIGAQALLLALAMRLALKALFDHTREQRTVLLVGSGALLAVISPLSKLAGRMMPDVFAPITLLLLLAALRGGLRLSTLERSLAAGLFVVTCFTHTSHWMIFAVTTAVMSLLHVFVDKRPLRQALLPIGGFAALLPLAMAFQIGMSRIHRPAHHFSPGSHAMLAAVFSETGALKRQLDRACPTENYRLCDTYTMASLDAGHFLWRAKTSPFHAAYGEGKGNVWNNSAAELNAINKAVLLSPRTWFEIALRGVRNSVVLLNRPFHVESSFQQGEPGRKPYQKLLKRHLPADAGNFGRIKQGSAAYERYEGDTQLLFRIALTFAVLGLLGAAATNRLPEEVGAATRDVLVALVCNALVCGALSGIAARYNERLIWLVVWMALILLFDRTVAPLVVAASEDAT